MDRDPEHWEGKVSASDYLSVTEIEGVSVVVFVATAPGTEKVRITVRHAKKVD